MDIDVMVRDIRELKSSFKNLASAIDARFRAVEGRQQPADPVDDVEADSSFEELVAIVKDIADNATGFAKRLDDLSAKVDLLEAWVEANAGPEETAPKSAADA